jgi:hypothetical protein
MVSVDHMFDLAAFLPSHHLLILLFNPPPPRRERGLDALTAGFYTLEIAGGLFSGVLL